MHRLRYPLFLALLALSLGLARLVAQGTATDIYGLNYTGYNNYTLLGGDTNDPNWQVTYADVEGQSYSGNSQYTGAAYVIDDSPYISSEDYVQNSSQSQWITTPGAATSQTTTTSTNLGGNYLPGNGTSGSNSAEFIYTMTFSITGTGSVGMTVSNDVAINLTIAADDDYAIYVDAAVNTNTHSSTYGDLMSSDTAALSGSNAWTNSTMAWLANYSSSSFSSNAGFKIGTNTISIVVTNSNEIPGTTSASTLNPSGLLVYEIGGEGMLVNGSPVPEVGAWLPVAGALGLFGFLVWRRKEWLPSISA